MASYECIFIMRQDLQAQDVYKAADSFLENLKDYRVNLVKKEYWGLRSLSYIIKKNKKAHYIMLCLDAEASAIKELERQLGHNENVLRYLSVRCDSIDSSPSPMMSTPVESRSIGN